MNNLKSSDQRANENFYIPKKEQFFLTEDELRKWYSNLLWEVSLNDYPEWALRLLEDKRNYYGKYFSESTRGFFLNHFGKNLEKTINFFFSEREKVKYFEIGSGCGNQLLLMALLGAEVTGCDIREDVCRLTEKRKAFYEKVSARKLNIHMVCDDALKVEWELYGMFDAINFLFSYNDIQNSEHLIEIVTKMLKPGGRVAFQETNESNYYNRLFRKRNSVLPKELARILELNDFKIHSLKGGYALPPFCWNILPEKIVASFDRALCKSLFLSPSYHLMAEKL